MSWRIGIDVGGTFTDVVLADATAGRLELVKVPTTPRDLAAGVLQAIETARAAHGIGPGDVEFLAHATTVVTNALLEGRGARVALVTTRGFRDVLELRRSARAALYDLFQPPSATLVPRHLRLEVAERVAADGSVLVPLDLADVDRAAAFCRAHRVDAVAVAFLFSFANDAHERAAGARLRALLPGVPVFLSAEVLPEIREFERASTTAVSACVGPLLASYLERLEDGCRELGLPRLYVMTSSGGVLTAPDAVAAPATVVESGPAAGVMAAALAGQRLGLERVLAFDMGGTTAKASLIERGEVATTPDYEVGGGHHGRRWLHGTGHPIRVPVVDLAEVSAGGGSLAWVDPGGALRVGPASAGAEPGPACYAKGGTRPTVTDADMALGYLDPVGLLDGALPVSVERARAAIAAHVAGPLGLSVLEAAAGIVDVVTANMAAALRIVSVERGRDPREHALVAFGGAGPVHAARLAAELGIPRVVIPPVPGGFSALGLVASDVRRDWARTCYARLDLVAPETLAAVWADMEAAARKLLGDASVPEERWELARAADLRYPRQAYELTVAVASGPVDPAMLARAAADFHVRHRETYGHANPDEPVQLVNLRLAARGRLERFEFPSAPPAAAAPERTRAVYFRETGLAPCAVVRRSTLAARTVRPGPLIVEAPDTTIVVPPGWQLEADDRGFLLLEASRG